MFFVAVPLDRTAAAAIEPYRAYMREHYGCRSGQRTPPHITLIPPFKTEDKSTEEVAAILLESVSSAQAILPLPFSSRALIFGAFGHRTLYAKILPDERWNSLRDTLWQTLSNELPLPPLRTPFIPHLTIANRDIPPQSIREALDHLNSKNVSLIFTVDRIALYELQEGCWMQIAETRGTSYA